MPMVCERRGGHPTVIGNTPLPLQKGTPTPHTFGPPFPFCPLLILSWTPTRAPTGSRPLSTRSTSHTRQQERAHKHSVRYISRSCRRTSRLSAPISADHHRHAHLEEKQIASRRSMGVRTFRSILTASAVLARSSITTASVHVMRSSVCIDTVSMYSLCVCVICTSHRFCCHVLVKRCSMPLSLAIA